MIIKEDFTQEDLKIIKGCLLTTKETFKCIPFKDSELKRKIEQITMILNKFSEGD